MEALKQKAKTTRMCALGAVATVAGVLDACFWPAGAAAGTVGFVICREELLANPQLYLQILSAAGAKAAAVAFA